MSDDHTREPAPTRPAAVTDAVTAPRPDGVGAPPRWARAAVYGFGATVGGCALAASGVDLFGLAFALGFALGTCLAVPIGLDAGAVVCGVRWITAPPESPQRARWRNATLGLVAASAVLNGLSVLAAAHWLTNAVRRVGDVGLLPGGAAVVIAVVIAAAFPLVAAWMVHAILEVRDAAARARGSRPAGPGRPRLLRQVLVSLAAWARERAAEHRAQRAVAEAQKALLLSPPDREEPQEPSDLRGKRRENDREEEGEDEETASDPDPEPPALTGHKLADARAWFRHERAQGRSPLPVDLNRWIGSDGYVKSRHVEQWQAELDGEPPHEVADVDELQTRRRLARAGDRW